MTGGCPLLVEGVTEELKARAQMGWVGVVNNISNRVEATVPKEIKYFQANAG